jgi:hypothetical protein
VGGPQNGAGTPPRWSSSTSIYWAAMPASTPSRSGGRFSGCCLTPAGSLRRACGEVKPLRGKSLSLASAASRPSLPFRAGDPATPLGAGPQATPKSFASHSTLGRYRRLDCSSPAEPYGPVGRASLDQIFGWIPKGLCPWRSQGFPLAPQPVSPVFRASLVQTSATLRPFRFATRVGDPPPAAPACDPASPTHRRGPSPKALRQAQTPLLKQFRRET